MSCTSARVAHNGERLPRSIAQCFLGSVAAPPREPHVGEDLATCASPAVGRGTDAYGCGSAALCRSHAGWKMGHRCDRALDAILGVRTLGAICVKYDSPLSLLAFVLLTSATLRDAKDRMRRRRAFGLWRAGGEPREGGCSMETCYAGNASPVAPAANLCVNLPRRTSVGRGAGTPPWAWFGALVLERQVTPGTPRCSSRLARISSWYHYTDDQIRHTYPLVSSHRMARKNLTDSMCNCDGAIKEGVPALHMIRVPAVVETTRKGFVGKVHRDRACLNADKSRGAEDGARRMAGELVPPRAWRASLLPLSSLEARVCSEDERPGPPMSATDLADLLHGACGQGKSMETWHARKAAVPDGPNGRAPLSRRASGPLSGPSTVEPLNEHERDDEPALQPMTADDVQGVSAEESDRDVHTPQLGKTIITLHLEVASSIPEALQFAFNNNLGFDDGFDNRGSQNLMEKKIDSGFTRPRESTISILEVQNRSSSSRGGTAILDRFWNFDSWSILDRKSDQNRFRIEVRIERESLTLTSPIGNANIVKK
ncbi:hypothetical protein C8R45DRAFT_923709 [Mycena sanguinolenta]|nr:hypothetical protein C8R45DRAFT_923709 [Mycena sanguinolenta]